MPDGTDRYAPSYDPLHLMRVLKWSTSLIVYPAVALLIPLDHFLLGTPWLNAAISHGVGGILVATLGIEFGFWIGFKLRKQAAYPTMLAMELGATEDFGPACEKSAWLLAELLGAEKVLLAWRNDEDDSLITLATHGIAPEDVAEAMSPPWWQQTARQAIEERKVVVVPADKGQAWQSNSSGRSWVACVPLLSPDQVVGVLVMVGERRAADFRDKTLLAPIGLVVGLTLENLRRAMELRRRTDEYVATTNLTVDVIARLDNRGRWAFLNDAACQFLGKSREELLGTDSRAYVHPEDAEATIQAIRETRAKKRPTLGFANRFVTPMGIRVVEWNGHPLFDEEDEYAGVQITGRDITERKQMEEERDRLYAELEVKAVTDGLTGLYNHAHFYERLEEEIERSKRYKHGFAVVMMDVNNFKQYNDSRGHQAGDEALRLIATCIRSGLRRSDLAFRYGGDEFAAILPCADLPKAQTVVDRINRSIAARLQKMDDPAAAWLGLSAGIACFPKDTTSLDELVRTADAALYGAKRLLSPSGVASHKETAQSTASKSGPASAKTQRRRT
jgi:diguanylate cyclase (GGDEF)-like protein/PAS domain S-box-containing protein